MDIRKVAFMAIAGAGIMCSSIAETSCSGRSNPTADRGADVTAADSMKPSSPDKKRGPGGFAIDKSGDATLQSMIKEVAPKFKQHTYTYAAVDGKEGVIEYNLYTPENIDSSKKYPLVLFIADASTAGKDVKVPLTQGYGALVWATPESQAKNPCYVLVPQLATGATNDDYQHSAQVDDLMGLVKKIVAENQIDPSRLYSTGQSMGGMISMYYDVAYPEMFAASVFVDSHWDASTFPELVKHKFVWFIAGDGGKAYPKLKPLEEAAEKAEIDYTFTEWSAKLPEAQQNDLASAMLEKGAPINIFEFETGSVLPEGMTKGIDHMYSFDYAYKISSVRDWLFKQTK